MMLHVFFVLSKFKTGSVLCLKAKQLALCTWLCYWQILWLKISHLISLGFNLLYLGIERNGQRFFPIWEFCSWHSFQIAYMKDFPDEWSLWINHQEMLNFFIPDFKNKLFWVIGIKEENLRQSDICKPIHLTTIKINLTELAN